MWPGPSRNIVGAASLSLVAAAPRGPADVLPLREAAPSSGPGGAVRVYPGLSGLERLRPDWETIAAPWGSPMMSPAWIQAWAEVYGLEQDVEFRVAGDRSVRVPVEGPEELRDVADSFNQLATSLDEQERLRHDFIANAAHELRTPLTSIREGTNMFLEGLGGEVSERQRELLTIIAEESSRLLDMVNPLLELSKLEAGVLPINISRTDLALLIARPLREVAPLAAGKNITIESDIAELPPASVDAERILQVLRNLIGNALKFTPPGGTVSITARREGKEVRISVADTGPGIPAEEIGTVFEKFRQASSVPSPRVQGTGLGLAIVRHIVQSHGGRVWAESKVGQGCTFTFALPV